MRRKEREVTDYNKMIEILKSCDCCRIGLVDDKGAYIVPMNFGYEDNNGKSMPSSPRIRTCTWQPAGSWWASSASPTRCARKLRLC